MTNEQLCALAKQGDADAQNLLIEKNLRFIKKTAYEVWNTQSELNRALHITLMTWCRKGRLGCAPGAVFRTRKKPPPKRHGSSEQISESFTETSLGWWIGKAVVGSIAMYMR